MITIQRHQRERYSYTKPDGRRGWSYGLFEPKREPYYAHLTSCFTQKHEEFGPGAHGDTVSHFLRFFPEIAAAINDHDVTISSGGGFDYSTSRGRTHIRAEGRLKNLRGFVAQIDELVPFFTFFEDVGQSFRFNYFAEDEALAREFCPHRVEFKWPRLGEYKDAICSPHVYSWRSEEFWFRSEFDAALALMVRS